MQYFISFLEGIVTFISPCLLPMLPIYISYFAGGKATSTRKTLQNASGFVLGFTIVFVHMGALAGSLGALLMRYQTLLNIVTGLIVICFGLHFLGVFHLSWLRGMRSDIHVHQLGFFSAMTFGFVFSLGWTPCVGAFLGSALAMASQQGHMLTGILMLLCYSLGLGIPFVISALLIDKLKGAFSWIKRNYRIIDIICGILLILIGVLMMTGTLGWLLAILG